MAIRILFALPLLLLFYPLIKGGVVLYILEFIIVTLALNEFYNALEYKNIYPLKFIGVLFSIYLFLKNFLNISPNITILVLLILFLMAIVLSLIGKYNIIDISLTFLGLIYICVFLDYLVLIRNQFEIGIILICLTFIITISTDTFAYFTGYFLGKHKLIPKISPQKTLEGSIGGVLGSIIASYIYASIFSLNLYLFLFIGFVGSIISQIGDLLASSIKRYVGIKDFSHLIPGHGGVLDRIDSVLLLAPFIYYINLFMLI